MAQLQAELITFAGLPFAAKIEFESIKKQSFEPESNQRPMDYYYNYSPPLYQLSYQRI